MRKITFAVLLIGVQLLTAQQTVNIGSNPLCGSSINGSVPADYDSFSGNNSWSAMIYKASDINFSSGGNITTLGFIADCRYSACSFDEATNQKIYIKQVSENAFTNTNKPDTQTMTEVFSGSITWKRGTGAPYEWTTITLDNPFEYNGSSNLLIYFENNYGNTLGGFLGCGSSPSYLVNNLGENSVLYQNYDTTIPQNGTLGNQIPLLQLTFGSTLSILENTLKEPLLLQKSDGQFMLQFEAASIRELEILSMEGKKVLSYNIPSVKTFEFSVQTLKSGYYIMRIKSSEKVFFKKIILP